MLLHQVGYTMLKTDMNILKIECFKTITNETYMIQNMLRYYKVSTDLEFVDIATTNLEICPSVKAGILNNRDTNSN